MKKKVSCIILCIIFLCSIVPEHVNANAIDTPADNPVIEEYSYIHSIDCRVKIRNGSAIITALSYGFQSVTRIEMTVEVQEKFALF